MSRNSKHMKRYATPRTWSIPRKQELWAVSPEPGAHPKEDSLPLMVVLRDILHIGQTSSEVKKILGRREVLVDGKPRVSYKLPVGLMDVISIPKLKDHYRVMFNPRGKIVLKKIEEKDAGWKLARILNKTIVKGGKVQYNLHDGRNIISDKDQYRTGDVLKISLPEQKVLKSYKLEDDSLALLTGGAHIGTICKIKKIEKTRNPMPNIVEFHEGFNTIVDYVFLVGKETSELQTAEVSIL